MPAATERGFRQTTHNCNKILNVLSYLLFYYYYYYYYYFVWGGEKGVLRWRKEKEKKRKEKKRKEKKRKEKKRKEKKRKERQQTPFFSLPSIPRVLELEGGGRKREEEGEEMG